MAKGTIKSNQLLQSLIAELRKRSYEQDVALWSRVALELERPTRHRHAVNLYKISRHVRENEIALVPGKVLAVGELDKKITVASFAFSQHAMEKINKTGKALTISELMESNPKGSNVRLII